MLSFYDFITTYSDVLLSLVFGALGLLCFIITFIRTGSVQKAIKDLKEVNELKYKNFNKPSDGHPQSFTPYEKDYILDPSTNNLIELEVPKNVQAYIDSHIECALERALQKFMPNENVKTVDDVVEDYHNTVDDLARVADYIDVAEHYREEMHLPDSYSVSDIYSAIDKRAQELKKQLEEYNKKGGEDSGKSS